jgi:hypothetical protein
MADTTPNNFGSLDAFMANAGISQPTTKADLPTPAQIKTKAKKVAADSAATDAVSQARNDATNAAASLQVFIARYKEGGIPKELLNQVFEMYNKAQDKLYTMDAPSAQEINQKFFPAAGANGEQAQPLRYGVNGESLVPGTPEYKNGLATPVAATIVYDKNGQPVKNPDGSYKTAVGATAPDATPVPSKTKTSGTAAGGYTVVTPTELANQQYQVAGPNLNPDVVTAKWGEQYGGIGAMAMTIPWMKNLLAQAAAGGWNATRFTNAVKNYTDSTTGQKPWDQISQAYRDSTLAYYDNKQAWGQQYNDKLDILQKSAIAQGEDPSVFGSKIDLTSGAAIDAAYKDQHNGVNSFFNVYYNNVPDQNTIDKYVSNHTSLAKTDNNVYAGVIGQNADALTSYADSMGISPMLLPSQQGAPGDYFANAAKAVQDGTTTMEEQQNYIKQQAIATYAPFANRIKEGMTVQSLASPYINTAANLLEISPNKISLGDTQGLGSAVTKALQGDGTSPMALDKFMTSIKQRPEWLQTTNARNSLMDTATTLLRNFGMVTGG